MSEHGQDHHVREEPSRFTRNLCTIDFRYLQDIHPTRFDNMEFQKLITTGGSDRSAADLAPTAFPEEWSTEWTRWLQGLVSLREPDAAALGPALGAALAAIDGRLEQEQSDGGSNGSGGDDEVKTQTVVAGRVVEGGSMDETAESGKALQMGDFVDDDYSEVEARPSPHHPWMSVLTWPAPGGMPRTKNLRKGDFILLLAQEAGNGRRGCVDKVHSAKMGIMSVELCADEGVKVLQLSCTQYRLLTSEEVSTIERAIGCAFMQQSPAEAQQPLQQSTGPPVEAVTVTKLAGVSGAGACASISSTLAAAAGRWGAADWPATRRADAAGGLKLSCDTSGASQVAWDHSVGGGYVDGAGMGIEAKAEKSAHRTTLWDEVGCVVGCVHECLCARAHGRCVLNSTEWCAFGMPVKVASACA